MAKDYKIFHCSGDKTLSECLANEEKDGYELLDIKWTGNITPPGPPPGLLTPSGQQTQVGIIHLYLVIFVRMTKSDAVNQMMGGKTVGKA